MAEASCVRTTRAAARAGLPRCTGADCSGARHPRRPSRRRVAQARGDADGGVELAHPLDGIARELPQAGEKASVALEAATRKEPRRERTPRVDQAELLRRTFAVEASEVGARSAPVRGAGLRQVPGVRSVGARLRAGALRELQGRASHPRAACRSSRRRWRWAPRRSG